jgi:CheY-like chemotaxis protein
MALDHPRILVVDDDDELRQMLVATLTAKGYEMTAARNGREALEILKSGVKPDLILMDLCMPEMDGWQLRHLLGVEHAVAVPIVVMTAAPAQTSDSLAVGEVLAKPFSLDQLLTCAGTCWMPSC